ncbi:DUF2947 family protein [Ferrimonas balearica]|uniref:DUF2947 family protein n=1 Tax=Ferrimonas balearica TaxID=44012 RepID=UPI001C995FF6|nr:DUF2947 family protein [Ferrimonas balearica]MBY5993600.1 DUF2947 domain-containing protein [Ferrimonas balearica]
MKYTDIEQYPFLWVFRRADLAIPAEDLAQIRPLAPAYAKQVWQREVSQDAVELERLDDKDWPSQADTWSDIAHWDQAFDSDEPALPAPLAEHLGWVKDTLVYICYDCDHVLETRYSVFQRSWKAFLFAADQALVVGRKRAEALWFVDEQQVRLGRKA